MGCPHTSPQIPPGSTGFLLPFFRAGMGLTKPGTRACAPRGTGDFGGTGLLPPLPQARCPSESLCTKQSLLSNFKCYLRTPGLSPRRPCGNLFFTAAEAASIKDTLSDEGGVLPCLSPSVAGAGPERTLRTATLGTHTSSWVMHTRASHKPAITCNTHTDGGLKHVCLVCDTG